MVLNYFKTILIDGASELKFEKGCLLIHTEEKDQTYFMGDIQTIIISSGKTMIETKIIQEAVEQGIGICFTNNKHQPWSGVHALHGNQRSDSRLNEQIEWSKASKNRVWKEIIAQKIMNQEQNLLLHHFSLPSVFYGWRKDLNRTNVQTMESKTARGYFSMLFGQGFNRDQDHVINACLNYGYAILITAINRHLTALGYHSERGIHHNHASNRFNLSYDIIEPFRPLIDAYVIENPPLILDYPYKVALIELLQSTIIYAGKRQLLEDAIGLFVLDVMESLRNTKHKLPMIAFNEMKEQEILTNGVT